MFERMAKFAGYGFNKCHAAPYALISYQTAWLKANAPVEFFAASMSLDLSNTDKLAVFYQDAKRQKVAIASPDINRSGADFEVADGKVLYALGAVRNVGRQAMEHVVEVRRAGGAFTDIVDFVERIDPRQINKRALESLARAGAFDAIHRNRAQIIAAADSLVAYAQSVAADRASAQESLFGERAEASRPRLAKVEAWNPVRELDEELAAVGFYLSGHPLGDMVDVLRRHRTTFYVDAVAQAIAGSEAFRMVGMVRRKQERSSSTMSGGKFAFVTLSDPTGEYEVMFQPETLRRCRDLLEPGASIVLRVRAKANDGEVRFFADDAEPLDRAIEKVSAGLRIHLSPEVTEIDALKARLKPQANGGAVNFVAAFHGREVEIRIPGKYQLDPATRGALKIAPGVALLEDV